MSRSFPRFGLPVFAAYRGLEHPSSLTLKGEVANPTAIDFGELVSLPRVEQVSDLHCVTTWSYCGIRLGRIQIPRCLRAIAPAAGEAAQRGAVGRLPGSGWTSGVSAP